MRIKTQTSIWERQPGLSPVAQEMIRRGTDTGTDTEVGNCLICADTGVERPGVCMTLFECLKEGEEAIASMAVCRAHRAQWRRVNVELPLDGQCRTR